MCIHSICSFSIFLLQVEINNTTGLPEDQLTEVAVAECTKVGSNALTVSDVLCNGGDSCVLRMIQRGIDSVNRRAMSRAQKVRTVLNCIVICAVYVNCIPRCSGVHDTFTFPCNKTLLSLHTLSHSHSNVHSAHMYLS